MSSMAEDELLNYLMEGSESYKRIIESQILTVKVENSCIESTLNKAIETAGTYISVKETDDSVSSLYQGMTNGRKQHKSRNTV